jgi:hypothetical protein
MHPLDLVILSPRFLSHSSLPLLLQFVLHPLIDSLLSLLFE